MAFCKLLITRYHVGIKSMVTLWLDFDKNENEIRGILGKIGDFL